MGSIGKAVVLQAAPLELCTKKPSLSNRNPEMCRDLSLQLQSPSGTWGLLSKTFLQLFSAVIFVCNTSFIHGVSKELPLPFCPRDGFERGDWRWLNLSGLKPCPPAQWDILVGAAALSCHVPAEGTRTLQLHQNPGDYLLFPDCCFWVAASSDVCMGRGGSLRYKWPAQKNSWT